VRASSNALIGYLMGFGNNGGTAYVAEIVGTQKFPIPRSMATGAVVQTNRYYSGFNCSGVAGVLPTEVGPGAYFVSGTWVFRAGATTTSRSFVSYHDGTSCLSTSFSSLAMSATQLTSGGIYSPPSGPLVLEYP